jgi:hypothetical protein
MQECTLNQVFANRSEEEEIFPLNTPEIVETQKADDKLKHCVKRNTVLDKGLEVRIVDNTYMVCKDGRMIIAKPLQRRAVLWFHHYLQHPGHIHLEETIKATMYRKGMRTSIRSITKSYRAFQIKMEWRLKYGHPLPKTIITAPWRALCVNSLTPKSVPAGTRLILFGRYVLNIYVGIV